MGKIKKILENNLVGGTQSTDVYPITSTKAVYDENNERLDNILEGLWDKIGIFKNAGYLYVDVATPTTDPGTPKAKVFYIANGKGTYDNFGGIEVTEDEVVFLYWDSSWHKVSTGIASQRKLTELKEKVDALALGAFYGYFPDSSSLPVDVTTLGYAYVGLDNPYKIWNFNGESWSDSGTFIDMNDADEEDTTRNADGKLQFKDRAYGDGMGYVILRKNKTFEEQVIQDNTIYEIRYDFEVGGTPTNPFAIPNNCVLKFNGGTLANGYIKGLNTAIEAPISKIFTSNLYISGIWDVSVAYPEWFGAKSNDNTFDCRESIQKCVDSFNSSVLTNIYYILSDDGNGTGITLPQNHSLNGIVKSNSTDARCGIISLSNVVKKILVLNTGCTVTNLNIIGNVKYADAVYNGEYCGIYSFKTSRLVLKDINIQNCDIGYKMVTYLSQFIGCVGSYVGTGFDISGTEESKYTSCVLINCYSFCNRYAGYKFYGIIYSSLISCACDQSGIDTNGAVIGSTNYLASYYFESCKGITMLSCGNESSARFIQINNCSYIKVIGADVTSNSSKIGDLATFIYLINSSGILLDGYVELYSVASDSIFATYHHYTGELDVNEIRMFDAGKCSIVNTGTDTLLNLLCGVVFNYKSKTNEITDTDYLTITENNGYSSVKKIKFVNGTHYIGGSKWVDLRGNTELQVIGVGNSMVQVVLDLSSAKLIKGFRSVKFENISFSFSSDVQYLQTSAIDFENTNVSFENCEFRNLPGRAKQLFNTNNAFVRFVNTYIVDTNIALLHPLICNVDSFFDMANAPSDYYFNEIKAFVLPMGTRVKYSTGVIGISTGSAFSYSPFNEVRNSINDAKALVAGFTVQEKLLASGSSVFCIDVNKYIYWTGAKWIDSTGVDV